METFPPESEKPVVSGKGIHYNIRMDFLIRFLADKIKEQPYEYTNHELD